MEIDALLFKNQKMITETIMNICFVVGLVGIIVTLIVARKSKRKGEENGKKRILR